MVEKAFLILKSLTNIYIRNMKKPSGEVFAWFISEHKENAIWIVNNIKA